MNKWEVDLGVMKLIVVYVSYCFSLSFVFRLYGDIRILSKYFTILGPECEMNSKHFLASRDVIDCHIATNILHFPLSHDTHVHGSGPVLSPLHRGVVNLKPGLEPGHGKVHGYHHRLKQGRLIVSPAILRT